MSDVVEPAETVTGTEGAAIVEAPAETVTAAAETPVMEEPMLTANVVEPVAEPAPAAGYSQEDRIRHLEGAVKFIAGQIGIQDFGALFPALR